jgi:hypothetical protein
LVWMLPIAGPLIQEAPERVTFAELPGFTGAHDPGTAIGVLVQVPFALFLVWLARRRVRAARAIAQRLARRMQDRLRRGPPRLRASASARSPRIASVALHDPQRGPSKTRWPRPRAGASAETYRSPVPPLQSPSVPGEPFGRP